VSALGEKINLGKENEVSVVDYILGDPGADSGARESQDGRTKK